MQAAGGLTPGSMEHAVAGLPLESLGCEVVWQALQVATLDGGLCVEASDGAHSAWFEAGGQPSKLARAREIQPGQRFVVEAVEDGQALPVLTRAVPVFDKSRRIGAPQPLNAAEFEAHASRSGELANAPRLRLDDSAGRGTPTQPNQPSHEDSTTGSDVPKRPNPARRLSAPAPEDSPSRPRRLHPAKPRADARRAPRSCRDTTPEQRRAAAPAKRTKPLHAAKAAPPQPLDRAFRRAHTCEKASAAKSSAAGSGKGAGGRGTRTAPKKGAPAIVTLHNTPPGGAAKAGKPAFARSDTAPAAAKKKPRSPEKATPDVGQPSRGRWTMPQWRDGGATDTGDDTARFSVVLPLVFPDDDSPEHEVRTGPEPWCMPVDGKTVTDAPSPRPAADAPATALMARRRAKQARDSVGAAPGGSPVGGDAGVKPSTSGQRELLARLQRRARSGSDTHKRIVRSGTPSAAARLLQARNPGQSLDDSAHGSSPSSVRSPRDQQTQPLSPQTTPPASAFSPPVPANPEGLSPFSSLSKDRPAPTPSHTPGCYMTPFTTKSAVPSSPGGTPVYPGFPGPAGGANPKPTGKASGRTPEGSFFPAAAAVAGTAEDAGARYQPRPDAAEFRLPSVPDTTSPRTTRASQSPRPRSPGASPGEFPGGVPGGSPPPPSAASNSSPPIAAHARPSPTGSDGGADIDATPTRREVRLRLQRGCALASHGASPANPPLPGHRSRHQDAQAPVAWAGGGAGAPDGQHPNRAQIATAATTCAKARNPSPDGGRVGAGRPAREAAAAAPHLSPGGVANLPPPMLWPSMPVAHDPSASPPQQGREGGTRSPTPMACAVNDAHRPVPRLPDGSGRADADAVAFAGSLARKLKEEHRLQLGKTAHQADQPQALALRTDAPSGAAARRQSAAGILFAGSQACEAAGALPVGAPTALVTKGEAAVRVAVPCPAETGRTVVDVVGQSNCGVTAGRNQSEPRQPWCLSAASSTNEHANRDSSVLHTTDQPAQRQAPSDTTEAAKQPTSPTAHFANEHADDLADPQTRDHPPQRQAPNDTVEAKEGTLPVSPPMTRQANRGGSDPLTAEDLGQWWTPNERSNCDTVKTAKQGNLCASPSNDEPANCDSDNPQVGKEPLQQAPGEPLPAEHHRYDSNATGSKRSWTQPEREAVATRTSRYSQLELQVASQVKERLTEETSRDDTVQTKCTADSTDESARAVLSHNNAPKAQPVHRWTLELDESEHSDLVRPSCVPAAREAGPHGVFHDNKTRRELSAQEDHTNSQDRWSLPVGETAGTLPLQPTPLPDEPRRTEEAAPTRGDALDHSGPQAMHKFSLSTDEAPGGNQLRDEPERAEATDQTRDEAAQRSSSLKGSSRWSLSLDEAVGMQTEPAGSPAEGTCQPSQVLIDAPQQQQPVANSASPTGPSLASTSRISSLVDVPEAMVGESSADAEQPTEIPCTQYSQAPAKAVGNKDTVGVPNRAFANAPTNALSYDSKQQTAPGENDTSDGAARQVLLLPAKVNCDVRSVRKADDKPGSADRCTEGTPSKPMGCADDGTESDDSCFTSEEVDLPATVDRDVADAGNAENPSSANSSTKGTPTKPTGSVDDGTESDDSCYTEEEPDLPAKPHHGFSGNTLPQAGRNRGQNECGTDSSSTEGDECSAAAEEPDLPAKVRRETASTTEICRGRGFDKYAGVAGLSPRRTDCGNDGTEGGDKGSMVAEEPDLPVNVHDSAPEAGCGHGKNECVSATPCKQTSCNSSGTEGDEGSMLAGAPSLPANVRRGAADSAPEAGGERGKKECVTATPGEETGRGSGGMEGGESRTMAEELLLPANEGEPFGLLTGCDVSGSGTDAAREAAKRLLQPAFDVHRRGGSAGNRAGGAGAMSSRQTGGGGPPDAGCFSPGASGLSGMSGHPRTRSAQPPGPLSRPAGRAEKTAGDVDSTPPRSPAVLRGFPRTPTNHSTDQRCAQAAARGPFSDITGQLANRDSRSVPRSASKSEVGSRAQLVQPAAVGSPPLFLMRKSPSTPAESPTSQRTPQLLRSRRDSAAHSRQQPTELDESGAIDTPTHFSASGSPPAAAELSGAPSKPCRYQPLRNVRDLHTDLQPTELAQSEAVGCLAPFQANGSPISVVDTPERSTPQLLHKRKDLMSETVEIARPVSTPSAAEMRASVSPMEQPAPQPPRSRHSGELLPTPGQLGGSGDISRNASPFGFPHSADRGLLVPKQGCRDTPLSTPEHLSCSDVSCSAPLSRFTNDNLTPATSEATDATQLQPCRKSEDGRCTRTPEPRHDVVRPLCDAAETVVPCGAPSAWAPAIKTPAKLSTPMTTRSTGFHSVTPLASEIPLRSLDASTNGESTQFPNPSSPAGFGKATPVAGSNSFDSPAVGQWADSDVQPPKTFNQPGCGQTTLKTGENPADPCAAVSWAAHPLHQSGSSKAAQETGEDSFDPPGTSTTPAEPKRSDPPSASPASSALGLRSSGRHADPVRTPAPASPLVLPSDLVNPASSCREPAGAVPCPGPKPAARIKTPRGGGYPGTDEEIASCETSSPGVLPLPDEGHAVPTPGLSLVLSDSSSAAGVGVCGASRRDASGAVASSRGFEVPEEPDKLLPGTSGEAHKAPTPGLSLVLSDSSSVARVGGCRPRGSTAAASAGSLAHDSGARPRPEGSSQAEAAGGLWDLEMLSAAEETQPAKNQPAGPSGSGGSGADDAGRLPAAGCRENRSAGWDLGTSWPITTPAGPSSACVQNEAAQRVVVGLPSAKDHIPCQSAGKDLLYHAESSREQQQQQQQGVHFNTLDPSSSAGCKQPTPEDLVPPPRSSGGQEPPNQPAAGGGGVVHDAPLRPEPKDSVPSPRRCGDQAFRSFDRDRGGGGGGACPGNPPPSPWSSPLRSAAVPAVPVRAARNAGSATPTRPPAQAGAVPSPPFTGGGEAAGRRACDKPHDDEQHTVQHVPRSLRYDEAANSHRASLHDTHSSAAALSPEVARILAAEPHSTRRTGEPRELRVGSYPAPPAGSPEALAQETARGAAAAGVAEAALNVLPEPLAPRPSPLAHAAAPPPRELRVACYPAPPAGSPEAFTQDTARGAAAAAPNVLPEPLAPHPSSLAYAAAASPRELRVACLPEALTQETARGAAASSLVHVAASPRESVFANPRAGPAARIPCPPPVAGDGTVWSRPLGAEAPAANGSMQLRGLASCEALVPHRHEASGPNRPLAGTGRKLLVGVGDMKTEADSRIAAEPRSAKAGPKVAAPGRSVKGKEGSCDPAGSPQPQHAPASHQQPPGLKAAGGASGQRGRGGKREAAAGQRTSRSYSSPCGVAQQNANSASPLVTFDKISAVSPAAAPPAPAAAGPPPPPPVSPGRGGPGARTLAFTKAAARELEKKLHRLQEEMHATAALQKHGDRLQE
eukprot:gene16431-25190_t